MNNKNMRVFIFLLFVIIAFEAGYHIKEVIVHNKIDIEKISIEKDNYVIKNSETALKVGAAVLQEYNTKWYDKIQDNMKVELEEGDIWLVYGTPKVSKQIIKKYSHYGGGLSVRISAKNGEIISINVED